MRDQIKNGYILYRKSYGTLRRKVSVKPRVISFAPGITTNPRVRVQGGSTEESVRSLFLFSNSYSSSFVNPLSVTSPPTRSLIMLLR